MKGVRYPKAAYVGIGVIHYSMLLIAVSLLGAGAAFAVENASTSFCINHPPEIYAAEYSIDSGSPGQLDSQIQIREGQSLSVYIYANDSDSDSISFVNHTSYVWNLSSPPAINVYLFSQGVGRISIPSSSTANYLDDRHTFRAKVLVEAVDNTSCSNNRDNISFSLMLIPFDNNIEFRSFSPATPHTMLENQSLTLTADYYEPDNNASLWIDYPDLFDPQGNNHLDDDTVYMQWFIDGHPNGTTAIPGSSPTGQASISFHTDMKSSGLHNIILIGNSSPGEYYYSRLEWNITVQNVNRPPYFIEIIPDFTWYTDNVLRAFYLADYATDPDVEIGDGDYLSFTMNYLSGRNITGTISPGYPFLVTFSQPLNFTGTQVVSFNVTDSHGAVSTSNNLTLTVLPIGVASMPGDEAIRSESSGPLVPYKKGSEMGSYSSPVKCEEQWYCSKWVCKPSNIMYRTCFDLNYCGTEHDKPSLEDSCTYIPECYDGIKNQQEDDVDCGGPCPPCWTCYDRQQNQGEEGIDCGGPCKPCPSCNDGIRNQNEDSVDCGGPCPPCGNCTDGILNGDEAGIDCGGICPACVLSNVDMGVSLKLGGYPLKYLAFISIAAAVFVVLITFFLRYGEAASGFLAQYSRKAVSRPDIDPKEGKGKAPGVKSRAGVVEDAFRELKRMERNLGSFNQNFLGSLNSIMRGFLMSRFGLNSGFTGTDLERELSAGKMNAALSSILVSYMCKISDLDYSGKEISPQEFHSLLLEAAELLQLVSGIRAGRMPGRRGKKARKGEDSLGKVFRLISASYCSLSEGESKDAAGLYHKALDEYEKLPDNEKSKAYGQLRRLHDEIDLFENVFS